MKYGLRDYRGGGRASSRETIGRVCAGAIAKKILAKMNIEVFGYVKQVYNIKIEKVIKDYIEKNPIRTADPDKFDEMYTLILDTKKRGDSVGSLIEMVITGVPVGIGEPVFDKLNAELSKAIMSIPAVKGIEFGAGFKVVESFGSENNDEITPYGFVSNNGRGDSLGGSSTGQDIIFRFVVKPPSSILIPKKTIDLAGNPVEVITEGRHDPCVAPRVVPIAEAMAAVVIVDMLMINNRFKLL